MSGFAIDPEDEAATLVGLLDGLLDRGVHVAGDLTIGLADVELVRVALRLLVASEDTAQRTGNDVSTHPPTSVPRDRTPPSFDAEAIDPARPNPTPTAAAVRPASRPGSSAPATSQPRTPDRPSRADDERQLADGVARLVLTVVAVIHDLVERQAIRRVEAGTLDDDQVERLGVALAALEDRVAEVRGVFGVTDEDLNLDLGPLGRLR
jgi:hypothetical protein